MSYGAAWYPDALRVPVDRRVQLRIRPEAERHRAALDLIAIVLVATAVAIIMTPAAYNRQTTPMEVTDDFVRVSTRLLLWSMFPLAVGISLDLYLIGRVIAGSIGGGVLSAGVFAVYVMLWFLLPRVRLIRRLIRSPK